MLSSTISSTTSTDIHAPRADLHAPRADLHVASAAPALPPRWTPDHVGERLLEAMRTLDRMPRPKGPRGAGNHWPAHRLEWADQLAQAELPDAERRARANRQNAFALRPGGAEIARMDKVLDWLRELRAVDADLAMLLTLWALRTARRRPLRKVCIELGISPPTFYKRRALALAQVADMLEGRGAAVF